MPDQDERPAPLTPPDCNLTDFEFMPVMIRRLLKSDTWVLGSDSERAAAVALWLESWHEIPAGSVPADDRKLAHLAQSRNWAKVREHVMRGFVLCSDGRYYHRIVAWKALESWLEKLLAQAAGGSTNAKRWGAQFDGPAMLARLQDSIKRLEAIEPGSKYLKKRAIVLAKQGVLPGAPHEPPPPGGDPGGDPGGESGGGSGGDPGGSGGDQGGESSASRNRQGQGQGHRQGQGSKPPSGEHPPTPRKRGKAAGAAEPVLIPLEHLVDLGVERQHAEDWFKVRKDKRLPLTRTAWDEVLNQADQAHLTIAEAVAYAAANSWGGFKAAWLARADTVRPKGNRQEQLEDQNRAKGSEWAARRSAT
jgi:hypothetical protein